MSDLTKYWGIIFLILITIFLIVFNIFEKNNSNDMGGLFFNYPGSELNFAGEELPNLENNYFIKERFDKEFLNTSYNLYQFFLYVKRLPLYMWYIEDTLDQYKIPQDFKYLPIAESALRNDVVSWAGAAGIWQFMPETAREYWLIVNDDIDERYHFEKATKAAAEYIDYLHGLFWNRTLVAASYNRWQNGIKKALEDQKVDNYYDLYLNEETSRYVFRILAIKYVLQDYEKKKKYIDKIIGGQYTPPTTISKSVWKIENLKEWALENRQSYQTIKTLNMWIKKDFLPEWKWEILIIK